jgi:hypothetical protein
MSGESTERPRRASVFRSRRQAVIAGAEVVIVFLALIRTVTSIYMVKAVPGNLLPSVQVTPIVTASTVAAVCCLILTLLYFFGRTRVMHVVFVLSIAALVIIKALLFKS